MTSTDTRPKRFVSRQHTNHPATLELLPSEFPATFPGSVLLFMPQVLRVYPVGQKMSSIPYKRNINWISSRVRCWPENLSIQSQNLQFSRSLKIEIIELNRYIADVLGNIHISIRALAWHIRYGIQKHVRPPAATEMTRAVSKKRNVRRPFSENVRKKHATRATEQMYWQINTFQCIRSVFYAYEHSEY